MGLGEMREELSCLLKMKESLIEQLVRDHETLTPQYIQKLFDRNWDRITMSCIGIAAKAAQKGADPIKAFINAYRSKVTKAYALTDEECGYR